MTLETATADKVCVVRPGARTRLVRVVADGDLITASEGAEILGVFTVNWVTRKGRAEALLRSVGSQMATLVNTEGTEIVEGLRVAIPLPRDGFAKPLKRALVFLIDPAIRVRHARAEAHA